MSHIIQATPELLEGWQGPILVRPRSTMSPVPAAWAANHWFHPLDREWVHGAPEVCWVDLGIATSRDRVLRVIGRRVWLDPFAAPVLHVSVRCGIVAALYLNDGSTWHGLHNPDWTAEGPQLPALSTFPEDLPDEPDLTLACIRMLWEALCQPASSDKLPVPLSGGAE